MCRVGLVVEKSAVAARKNVTSTFALAHLVVGLGFADVRVVEKRVDVLFAPRRVFGLLMLQHTQNQYENRAKGPEGHLEAYRGSETLRVGHRDSVSAFDCAGFVAGCPPLDVCCFAGGFVSK